MRLSHKHCGDEVEKLGCGQFVTSLEYNQDAVKIITAVDGKGHQVGGDPSYHASTCCPSVSWLLGRIVSLMGRCLLFQGVC